ncbi:hypothetical protein KQH50_03095 [bacterium]|nr:hypothetical protein [bacterium]
MSLLLVFSSGDVRAQAGSLSGEQELDPRDYLLNQADLLPLCEWAQGPIVTRPVAEGLLIYTLFECGVDPNVRQVRNFVLLTTNTFNPGDANYFTTMRDMGLDAAVDIGEWSKAMRTMMDYHGVAFTKGNMLVYVGANAGYFESYPPEIALVTDLAEILEQRLPDRAPRLAIPAVVTMEEGMAETEIALLSDPKVIFPSGEPSLAIPWGAKAGVIHFSVTYAEPHQTVLEIYRQGEAECVKNWIFSEATALSVSLHDAYGDQMPDVFHLQEMDAFFMNDGEYVLRAWADGVLISEVAFTTTTD